MDQLLGDAKRLVSRLNHHDNSVDILIAEVTNLQNKLVAMRQYRDEVSKLNDIADHRPRSTLILGSQLENQRIQNLKEENQELSISLAEHQSALELIMNKYREQVLSMMHPSNQVPVEVMPRTTEQTIEMVSMKERIAEMARIMWESAAIDDSAQIREIEIVRKLQVENENLRELLEISGGSLPPSQPKIQASPVGSIAVNGRNDIRSISPASHTENSGSSVVVSKEKQSRPDQNSINNVIFDSSSNNNKDDELLNSFSINKLKKKYNSKKTIFDSMSLYNFDQPTSGAGNSDSTDLSSTANEKESLNKLKQLFIPPDNISKETYKQDSEMNDSTSSQNDIRADYEDAVDPSENCFRAIISDIKPMEDHIDINEKLYNQPLDDNNMDCEKVQKDSLLDESIDNVNTTVIEVSMEKDKPVNLESSDSLKDTNDTMNDPVQTNENDKNPFDDNDTSVIECLDSFDSMIGDLEASFDADEDVNSGTNINNSDDETSALQDDEIADVPSVKSEVHIMTRDAEIKKQLEDAPSESSKEIESTKKDTKLTETQNLEESNEENENEESSVLDFLDDVLDFADNDDYDEDNDDDDDDEEDDDDDADEDCDENFEEEGDSGEDDACDEFTTTCKSTVKSSNVEEENHNTNIVLPVFKSQNPFSDLFDKKGLITKAELPSPPVLQTETLTPNGDISDTDSEVTYTEEDVNQALSDFDSFLDFNDDDDDECDELD